MADERKLIRKEIAPGLILLIGDELSVSYDINNPDEPVRVGNNGRIPQPIYLNSGEVSLLNEFQVYDHALKALHKKGHWPSRKEYFESIGLGWMEEEFADDSDDECDLDSEEDLCDDDSDFDDDKDSI
ncbi:hypothetical protein [Vibrio lentus]|uniref:hypothetical protein n=1 Tax=Vibrio lentus TaxID=136468 RepID=UPI001E61AE4C|nr:hypothetical protein [Vibrio lentus]MCC4838113.1 hypothetical protein [Vibrio lentus]